MSTKEFNFDGLVGPTHNYAGLSFGNVASATHEKSTSHPRAAALQGLEKMKFVRDLGIGQCVLPPLLRPNIQLLRDIGFSGASDEQIVENAFQKAPQLLNACFSASNMWTANAAMVSAATDCSDGRLHLTPANLSSKIHRAIEAPDTAKNLKAIFGDENLFAVHQPLPSAVAMSDEGAANFMRICPRHAEQGIEVFVWGRSDFGRYENEKARPPQKFPARQTLESCEAIAQRHGLTAKRTIFLRQHPDAIDAGVFHNDVISVANENVVLAHELAFADRETAIQTLKETFESEYSQPLHYIEFTEDELSVSDTVSSYLFNSQLVTRPDGGMTLVCPEEVKNNANAFQCTQKLLAEPNPVDAIEFLDLRQSMNNGGGPACLRLRVVMTEAQQAAMHPGVILTDDLYDQLKIHIEKHYRESLNPDELRDPKLIEEARAAHHSLNQILFQS